MNTLKERIHQIIGLVHSVKNRHLDWQAENQDRELKLSHARKIAENNLHSVLSKKNVQLTHEIALLKTRQNTELSMLKTRCKQDLHDYQQYLAALNQLKLTIQSSYSHLPEVIAHTIHHHAKSLLNAMWEAETLDEKIKCEAQLIKFMTTVHEEASLCRTGVLKQELPENTLKLIHQDNIEALL